MGYVENLRKLVGHQPIILVGSVVIIIDELGRILLEQRKHPLGAWGLPGGLMELGESTEDTARREVLEETGLEIGRLELINVWSGPNNFAVAANGDEFFNVTIAYFTKDFQGVLAIDKKESLDLKFFEFNQLPPLLGSHRKIIDHFLKNIRLK